MGVVVSVPVSELEEETAARTGTESPTAGDSYNTIAGKDDSGVIFFSC